MSTKSRTMSCQVILHGRYYSCFELFLLIDLGLHAVMSRIIHLHVQLLMGLAWF